MEEKTQELKDSYKEYKSKRIENDIKRCGAFAVTSGVLASLSALVVAGNIVVGNNLEAFQVGGAAAALFGYALCYSKMGDTYKKEKKSFEEQPQQTSFLKERLETLKYQLEIAETQLSLNYLVGGSFIASSIAHVIELISMPSAPEIIGNITCATLGAVVGTLNLLMVKKQKFRITANQEETTCLEEAYKLEEMCKQPIPELVEPQEQLVLEAPTEEEPKILQLEEITKKK